MMPSAVAVAVDVVGVDDATSITTSAMPMAIQPAPQKLRQHATEIIIFPQYASAVRHLLVTILKHNRRILDGVDSHLQSGWGAYRSAVQRYRTSLNLIDEAIDRILYLVPLHEEEHEGYSTSGSSWREILYGLLSLNRLGMDCSCAIQPEPSFGMTIRTETIPTTTMLPITKIRIVITVIHCIMPSLLELVPSLSASSSFLSSRSAFSRAKKQTAVRLLLERIKCALRLALMVSYWIQSFQEQQQSRTCQPYGDGAVVTAQAPKTTVMPILGLLRRGGMYQPDELPCLSLHQEQALERRRTYVGRRTGRRVVPCDSTDHGRPQSILFPTGRLVVAELLYVLRPLLWATAEAKTGYAAITMDHHPSPGGVGGTLSIYSLSLLKPWLLTLLMDLTSLQLTQHLSGTMDRGRNNHGISNYRKRLTCDEWNRRRMNLFFYLLRSPLWNLATAPMMEHLCSIVQRFPLVGGLMERYLRDYILYWKHPFSSEES
jgi:Peroxisomal membrane protein (Pex16)